MTEQVTKSSPLVAALLKSVESRSNGSADVSALIALARQQDAKLMAIRQLVEESIHRISIEELRAVLDATSES